MAPRRHKPVLMLERHFKSGGFTHAFERKGFQWDPGLHYVGDLQEGTTGYQFLRRSRWQLRVRASNLFQNLLFELDSFLRSRNFSRQHFDKIPGGGGLS